MRIKLSSSRRWFKPRTSPEQWEVLVEAGLLATLAMFVFCVLPQIVAYIVAGGAM